MDWSPRFVCRHDVLVGNHVNVSGTSVVSLTPFLLTSDSIFLLGGVVNVVLFCTIRRVIPIREVATALFTGKVFRAQEKSSTETTWCIGSLETGEKRAPTNRSLPTTNDYFVLRQPKFDIVTPPPAVLPDQTPTPVTVKIPQLTPTIRTEDVAHADSPQPPIHRTRPIPRKPLPREPSIYSDDGEGSSFSRNGSVRRLPPIPRGPRPLPSVVEKPETPPPLHHRAMTCSRQNSVASSHSHSASLNSVASDTSSMSGSTLFGSTDGDSLKGGDFPNHK